MESLLLLDAAEPCRNPAYDHFSFNDAGEVISVHTGTILALELADNGYLRAAVTHEGKDYKALVHRLVALSCIPKPEHLKHLPFSVLQVNHKDGNKQNNNPDNLEWCRAVDNIRHAMENGLHPNAIPVLARDVRTNEVQTFPTISSCARAFGLTSDNLISNLNSENAGKITKNWHVFKYDDGEAWPDLHEFDSVESKWGLSRVCIGRHLETEKIHLFESLRYACELLGFDYKKMMDRTYRYGPDTPYEGWLFEVKDTALGVDISGIKRRNIKKVQPGTPVQLIFKNTGRVETYPTLVEAGKAVDLGPDTLRYYLYQKDGQHPGFSISLV